ncbi:MAG TPA: hypothetical protein VLE48_01780 [Terriglobales bacterium]|nr:hypothetical protein [Terriglobales bacterium]
MRRMALLLLFLALAAGVALAQDPVKMDPKHYHVMFENDQVRVLHIIYAPGEKSVMHEHPDSVAVLLTDQRVKFTFPDGASEVEDAKAKDALWIESNKHLPENVGTGPFEVILVELKSASKK